VPVDTGMASVAVTTVSNLQFVLQLCDLVLLLFNMCQKERGFRGPGLRSAKLTECLALPERQSASTMVLTKLNPTK